LCEKVGRRGYEDGEGEREGKGDANGTEPRTGKRGEERAVATILIVFSPVVLSIIIFIL
jgi:hypothetical protein